MKKIVVIVSTFSLSLLTLTNLPITAFALTGEKKDATASFELVAPTETLEITKATDIIFKDAVISATDIVTTNSAAASITIQELSGEAPGWQLSAKLDDFIGLTNKKKLNGVEMFYTSIKPISANEGDVSLILPDSIATDNAFEGSKMGKRIKAGNDADKIVLAEVNKGYGVWTMGYDVGDIQLNIPAGNLKDNYTATLTYTLVDSPN